MILMPRKVRIDAPGALHHVMGRGANCQRIFSDKTDYMNFLERLGDLLIETKTSRHAWPLIANHFHLLLKTESASISILMKRLLTSYAVNYNRRDKNEDKSFLTKFT